MRYKRQSVNIDWEVLGAELAALSDEEQGAFFAGFTNELMHYPSHFAAESQCCYIGAKLTAEQREFMTSIGYEEEVKP